MEKDKKVWESWNAESFRLGAYHEARELNSLVHFVRSVDAQLAFFKEKLSEEEFIQMEREYKRLLEFAMRIKG